MSFLIGLVNIASYVLVIIAGVLVVFIYISLMFSDKIIRWRADKIKEKRREVIKIALQDLSLFIQISLGLGVAILLFSLSRTGVQVMIWGFFGLVPITTSVFLLFWRYLPLRNKMYSYYNSKRKVYKRI